MSVLPPCLKHFISFSHHDGDFCPLVEDALRVAGRRVVPEGAVDACDPPGRLLSDLPVVSLLALSRQTCSEEQSQRCVRDVKGQDCVVSIF